MFKYISCLSLCCLNFSLFLKLNCCILGALGVMFEYGIGVERDVQAAFECLKGASERGNIYAQGNLAMHYYRQKLFNQAFEIAERYSE